MAVASIYQGETARQTAKAGQRAQRDVQSRAESNAAAERIRAQQQEAKVRRKTQNLDAGLDNAMVSGARGVKSTMLTGGAGPTAGGSYATQTLLGG
jgi:hypothetical protein